MVTDFHSYGAEGVVRQRREKTTSRRASERRASERRRADPEVFHPSVALSEAAKRELTPRTRVAAAAHTHNVYSNSARVSQFPSAALSASTSRQKLLRGVVTGVTGGGVTGVHDSSLKAKKEAMSEVLRGQANWMRDAAGRIEMDLEDPLFPPPSSRYFRSKPRTVWLEG
jgi:hypothetical protein